MASRYARALFLLTEKRHETVAALPELVAVRELLAPGEQALAYLASPQIRLPDKRKALSGALEGRVNRSVAAFVDLLMRKKRLTLLPEIASEYEALVEAKQGIRRAHVVSAVPLAEAERTRLLAALEGYTKAKIRLTSAVDPAVVGGALVRIGDRVVDRTVHTLVESIGAQLREVSV